MAQQVASIELETRGIDRLIGDMPRRAGAILDKIAFDVERDAKPRTAYDTGALRNSIYVSGGSRGTSYGAATSEALSRRPKAGIVSEETAANRYERVIGASVNYAYWQELSQPFLVPAIENQRGKAAAMWGELFR